MIMAIQSNSDCLSAIKKELKGNRLFEHFIVDANSPIYFVDFFFCVIIVVAVVDIRSAGYWI